MVLALLRSLVGLVIDRLREVGYSYMDGSPVGLICLCDRSRWKGETAFSGELELVDFEGEPESALPSEVSLASFFAEGRDE